MMLFWQALQTLSCRVIIISARLLCDEWPYFGVEETVEESRPDPTSPPTSDALHHASYSLLRLLGLATILAPVAWMI